MRIILSVLTVVGIASTLIGCSTAHKTTHANGGHTANVHQLINNKHTGVPYVYKARVHRIAAKYSITGIRTTPVVSPASLILLHEGKGEPDALVALTDQSISGDADMIEMRDSIGMAMSEPDTAEVIENGRLVSSKAHGLKAKDRRIAMVTPKVAVVNTSKPDIKEHGPADMSHIVHDVVDIPAPIITDATEEMIGKYADLVGADPSDITNYPLYRFIDNWYGTRYRYGGTDHDGIDCSAFAQKLYSKVYATNILRTSRQQRKTSERIDDEEEVMEGDLVFFRRHRFRISHVGVYLTNGNFVHASSSKGVVISNVDEKYWRRRFAGYGRVVKEIKLSSESGIQ